MKILKFGGTSVGSPIRINQIKEIIRSSQNENGSVAVVVSAFGGVTDQLLQAGYLAEKGDLDYLKIYEEILKRHSSAISDLIDPPEEGKVQAKLKEVFEELHDLLHGIYLLKELSPKSLDLIGSFGERLSAYIISKYLDQSTPTEFLDARKLVKTDDNFTSAKVNFEKTNKNIENYFNKNKKLQIITGFIGSTDREETTTLGRGGSDYTASIFGAALNAKEIEIWTDVNGIMSADPRKVKKAFTLEGISYLEAMEMSHFGAKVIHPPTMQPALKKAIPIRIKNTMNPEFQGSLISQKASPLDAAIKGISSINNVSLIRIQGSGLVGVTGISQRLFGCMAKEKINIILISQASSEHSICFAINTTEAEKAKKVIEEEFSRELLSKLIDEIIIESDLSILAVVGENMRYTPGTAAKVFHALGQNSINIKAIAQGSSEINISIVIEKKEEEKALNVIHDSLFLSDIKTLNVFLVGPGLVGGTLLNQIEQNKKELLNNQNLEINIIGIINSNKMLIDPNGIENWKTKVEEAVENSDLTAFINRMQELNLANSIFVDCTSSENTTIHYEKILKSGISIVTPNKKALSGNIKNYINLTRTASQSNAKFRYETNVGAGLPVIKTIQDLQLSGDRIQKIEAVLSGTLSYIFNNFDGNKPFSEIVKIAREKGYTEPDPRDDLNGLDVARKILILARETNTLLEMEDIEVENLVPEDCRKTKSIEEFFQKLEEHDSDIEQRFKKALSEGKRLRYIATLQNGEAMVQIKEVTADHPFYNLSGSDNIIAIHTNFYKETPLVIKGPGAGAEVTAAGVMADIIQIANINFNTRLTKYSFIDKLKNNSLTISLIGMSNIGKSFWSKKLSELRFKHLCCDDLIEAELEPILAEYGFKGLEDMAKWLGQPYDPNFKEREKIYLEMENKVMAEILKNRNRYAKGNMVIDTTGSVIYTDEKILSDLKRKSLVVYLEASPEMKEEMFENYIKNPKPVIWKDSYKDDDLKKSYKELLQTRSKMYEELADITIPFHKMSDINESQFLKLIQEQL